MMTVQRTFAPGSEWIYFKIYTGNKIAEDVLVKDIFSIICNLRKKDLIEKWFFIRYQDPEFHLRLRILIKNIQYMGDVILIFHQRLDYWIKNNLLWKVQIDTYNRELDRYGNMLIEEAESIFCADSDCVISIIRKLNNHENYRWMIALKMIDCFLNDFSLDISDKQRLMETLSHSFKTEFGFNEFNSKQFNVKFRENKSIIESVLNDSISDRNFVLLYLFVRQKSKKLRPVIVQLKLKLEKRKNISLDSLLSSYIHMMLNRIFRSRNRLHELIVYDFMRRYYTSEIAKIKNRQKILE